MNIKKRNFIISGILLLIAIIFTGLVKVIDVQSVGVNGTNIGFATINQFVAKIIGVNSLWYNITELLGYIPLIMALGYAIIGILQLIKNKSVFKVDREIILLGVLYFVVIALYVFFEKVIINYRPVLIDGAIEASYPSSHTLMSICICGSAILINKNLFNNKIIKIINWFSITLLVAIVIGRLLSGYHWFTDIIGGTIISSALLMTFYSCLKILKKEN